jgi:hypothetical protein
VTIATHDPFQQVEHSEDDGGTDHADVNDPFQPLDGPSFGSCRHELVENLEQNGSDDDRRQDDKAIQQDRDYKVPALVSGFLRG